jgi:hypothetical protein
MVQEEMLDGKQEAFMVERTEWWWWWRSRETTEHLSSSSPVNLESIARQELEESGSLRNFAREA